LQSVIIHSANGGKGEGWHVEEYSVALQNERKISACIKDVRGLQLSQGTDKMKGKSQLVLRM
jgi:hypothetical protein